MDKELRDELEVFKYNLQITADNICDANELLDTFVKRCNVLSQNNDLQELFSLANNINDKFLDMINKFYVIINNKNNSATMEDVLRRIKLAVAKGMITLED